MKKLLLIISFLLLAGCGNGLVHSSKICGDDENYLDFLEDLSGENTCGFWEIEDPDCNGESYTVKCFK